LQRKRDGEEVDVILLEPEERRKRDGREEEGILLETEER
jgi:hypothetical protein